MKSKDEVFNKFQEFQVQVENMIGRRIIVLREGNGGD